MDLSSPYLGLRLEHPFIAGASPLADDLDGIRRLEDGGAAAIVLRSLFEEQITSMRSRRIHHMDAFEPEFQEVLGSFPKPDEYVLSPDRYLEHLHQAAAAARIPIIASLNGLAPESWLTMAESLEDAGAAAVELNPYEVVTDADIPGIAVEARVLHLVGELKSLLHVPLAVKVSPYFTAFGNMAHGILRAGADGLVMFNRFYQMDIDIERIASVRRVTLSSRTELLARLRWTAILRGRTTASLAVTGGVDGAEDGIKAILAGADAVQVVSAALRHGPQHFAQMRDGLARWLEAQHMGSVAAARGRLRLTADADADAIERGSYLHLLQAREHGEVADEPCW
jgi:dihydroorotate dehydrogenase (fumarate)